MKFSIGDKVVFKKENVKGKIVRINSLYKVSVLSNEGFQMNASVKDLVKIEKGTDNVDSYGLNFPSKDSTFSAIKPKKSQRSSTVLKVDLHIELLSEHYKHMDSFEIVQIQLNECYNKIQKALNSNITKLEIVHGIGEGVLKDEVHAILRSYDLRFYLTKDGGSTEVYL